MKFSSFLNAALLLSTFVLQSQVGINTTTPDGGAMLDITSTDKGVLVPRVDIADLSTIAPLTGSTTESLLVYNTNTTTGKGFYYWNGSNQWIKIASDNIYTSDGTIPEDRNVDLGSNKIDFRTSRDRDGFTLKRSSNTAEVGLSFQNSGSNYDAAIYLGSGTDAPLYISAGGRNNNPSSLGANAVFNDDGSSSFKSTFFYNNTLNTPSNVLGALTPFNSGGLFSLYENTGAVNHFLAGNGNTLFNNENLDVDFWINSVNRDHLFYVDASEDNVGIDTFAPQEKLHVAGTTSTVRIDGLNAANNANNNGTRPVALFVDANGNLVIPSTPSSANFEINQVNLMPNTGSSSITVATGTTGTITTGFLTQSNSFTLTDTAVVTVNYGTAIGIYKTDNTSSVDDGKPKMVHTFINVRNAATNALVTGFVEAIDGQSYTNSATSGAVSPGFMYNSGTYTGILPAGTYRVQMWASVFSNGTGGNANDAFLARFGGDTSDHIKVIVQY